MSFAEFFRKATNCPPYRYQIELGEAPLQTRVIRVPTGAGKTAAAVLPWLWWTNQGLAGTPVRLVLFLPMRALVIQTVTEIEQWLKKLDLTDRIALFELLGEHPELRQRNREWMEHPERPTIIIGTVDLLLSAALNRGYAMSRFRWPAAFGLLHNSALWIVDEAQLMGPATATFAQLEVFRCKFGTVFPVFTWWMSATVEPEWLITVDHQHPPALTPQSMSHVVEDLGIKYAARKSIRQAKLLSANLVHESHRGGLTLVVVNTVKRSQELFRSLAAPSTLPKKKKAAKAAPDMPSAFLIHSRFRPADRKTKMDMLFELDRDLRPARQENEQRSRGAIVIATQVAEAGLDVSARTMITELAAWSSLVQRFGRLNRTGQEKDAQAIWVDVREPAPYTTDDLKLAREIIFLLQDVGPASLAAIPLPSAEKPSAIVREHDFLGLFSTDKDLAGGFTDVSEFIRDSDDRDVYIGWRRFKTNPNNSPRQDELESYELCAVLIADAKDFRSNGNALWEWNDESGKWEPRSAFELVPGMTLLCNVSSGGYSIEMGWTGNEADLPQLAEPPRYPQKESLKTEDTSLASQWRELDLHLQDVEAAARGLCTKLSLPSSLADPLTLAARWHDIGKSLPAWQKAVRKALEKSNVAYREGIWAKFPARKGTFRPNLRHEEASALYVMELLNRGELGWSELAVYLVACHHGKLRARLGTYGVTSLRDVDAKDRSLQLPGLLEERTLLDCAPLSFAAPGHFDPATGKMCVDGLSWTALVASLLGSEDDQGPSEGVLGPFRLAYMEALIVAADIRASRNPEGESNA